MEDIKVLASRFKEKTVKMLACFDTEDYDELNFLLKERQDIIIEMQDNSDYYKKGDVIKEFGNSDIVELDKKLRKLINENMDVMKDKIKAINEKEFINKKYYNRFNGGAVIFNKKIY